MKKQYIIAICIIAFFTSLIITMNIVKENNIFIKPQYPVKLLKYLKNSGADRNIVHNNEFLRFFNKFENNLLKKGYSLEDIINNNIFIQDGVIYTKSGNNSISYKIENVPL